MKSHSKVSVGIVVVCIILICVLAGLFLKQQHQLSGGVASSTAPASTVDTLVMADKLVSPASGSIHITSPISGVSWDQNTLAEWKWNTIGKVGFVDMYLQAPTATYTLAHAYPNYGDFSWTAGAAYTQWKIGDTVPNGIYTLQVCPTGQATDSETCDSFTARVQGTLPDMSIISPRGGEVFRIGQSIAVRAEERCSE
jgi:hypothetical protein